MSTAGSIVVPVVPARLLGQHLTPDVLHPEIMIRVSGKPAEPAAVPCQYVASGVQFAQPIHAVVAAVLRNAPVAVQLIGLCVCGDCCCCFSAAAAAAAAAGARQGGAAS
jgi:hypothetical protein